ncbi:alpha-galactosidase [Candidatus Poribacteria bacterium]
MPKIAIMGAGGFSFPARLTFDILSFSELEDSTISLMDISQKNLDRVAGLIGGAVDRLGLPAKIEATTDRREALDGADYVIVTWQVGGIEAYTPDVEIPRKYGIDQCVGDTLGPGGVFRGVRSIPAYLEVCETMKEVCPDALMISYANPMSINTWAVANTGIKIVGLCHSVQGTSHLLATILGVPPREVSYKCYGINHQAWFTEFYHNGEDVYPALRRVLDEQAPSPGAGVGIGEVVGEADSDLAVDHGDQYHQERVRAEIMRTFGYFQTESSHHGSEYLMWFRKNPEMVNAYIPNRWDYYQICLNHDFSGQEKWIDNLALPLRSSNEYAAGIIHSMETDTKRVIYGNVPNWGPPGASPNTPSAHLIPNLPQNCIVEVACLVDLNGIQPTVPGPLPEGCAAINRASVNVQELAVKAGTTGDKRLLHQAIAIDPFTGAQLTLPRIREMVNEMLEAESQWLPQFK